MSMDNEDLGDLYKILQIDPEAAPEVVVVAYRRLGLKYHPDTNTSPGATQHMQQINVAYQVLRNPDARRQYDVSRRIRTSDGQTTRPSVHIGGVLTLGFRAAGVLT